MGSPIPLKGSPYDTRDPIPAARRCVNLYPEKNGEDAAFPYRYWPTPGIRRLATVPNSVPVRCLYTASNGELYAVAGTTVYSIQRDMTFTALGTLSDRGTPVSMSDNGLCIVIVDGTSSGFVIDMSTHEFGGISDLAFFGADRVDYVDTYFVFNLPSTNKWYISKSAVDFTMLTAGDAFDPLDIVAKTGGSDQLATLVVKSREVWLIGTLTSEVWYDAGSADFAFAQMPGSFIDHGCLARYSVAKQDVSLFWLARDREGQGIIVRTEGYGLKRISTHAIESEIRSYGAVEDAVGFCFQQNGHAFYAISFPTADKTWCYDLQSGQWHEWAWMDGNGVLHRHRANTHTFAHGRNIVGDWQNGRLYALDPDVLTDDAAPIPRVRTFPHLQAGGNLVTFNRFILDVQVGSDVSSGTLGNPDVTLRYSHDRGATWSEPLIQSLGLQGEYATQVDWWGLGCGRDTVFEVSYAAPVQATLGGAYVETEAHSS